MAKTDAQRLEEIDTAISQALKSQEWKHGETSSKLADLDTLYDMKEKLEARINRRRRGPRVTGITTCHS